jgi:hypothetical protein
LLAVNKDASAAASAVNVYPSGRSFTGHFVLKFDLWLNWANTSTSTEHALFGINHSGGVTNRVGQATSDGLFFAFDGDGGVGATSSTVRDFAAFAGGGPGAIPVLMLTNNTAFGPTPPLGPQFDNANPGFTALLPSKTIPGYPTTPAGTPGLGWVSVELRQEGNLITCLLNETAFAQYTNTSSYTSGDILLGYNDVFSSLGDPNNFVIFDNVRVELLPLTPVTLLLPRLAGNSFAFSFATDPYETYTVQGCTNLAATNWTTFTNLVGNGQALDVFVPLAPQTASQFFRVTRP